MRWEYDADAGSLYIQLRDGTPDHQVEMADGAILDVATDGEIIGLELVRAWALVDLPAIGEQFDLTPDELESIIRLLTSPLIVTPPRDGRADLEPAGLATTTATLAGFELVA
jgi:uncharacterized protein YuzE